RESDWAKPEKPRSVPFGLVPFGLVPFGLSNDRAK
ncbi:MAG: hypothetical protein RLZZ450_5326, partial [Pseudomonadota bacterium]